MNIRILKEGSIVDQHIKKNLIMYIIVLSTFILGVVIGTLYFNKIDNVSDVTDYLKNTIETIKSGGRINKGIVLKEAMLANIKTTVIIWLSGSAIIGVPLLIAYTGYRGFIFGFTISSIIATFGGYKGNLFVAAALVPQNIIIIPSIIFMIISGFKLSENVIKAKKNVKIELLRHTIICTIFLFFMVIAALIEAYVNTPLIGAVINSL
jgi:stage II sporulation protein M